VVGGAYLMVRVGWYLDSSVSNENGMTRKKNIPMAQETLTSLGPLSRRRWRSTRNPPHKQWLVGLGAGGVLSIVCCPLFVFVHCCLMFDV
jgi:hypothetical protein